MDIDDFEVVAPRQMPFAEGTGVRHGTGGVGRCSADEESQVDLVLSKLCQPRFQLVEGTRAHGMRPALGRSCSPTRTRSVSDKSPMILRIGMGSRRTSVGIARISSP